MIGSSSIGRPSLRVAAPSLGGRCHLLHNLPSRRREHVGRAGGAARARGIIKCGFDIDHTTTQVEDKALRAEETALHV